MKLSAKQRGAVEKVTGQSWDNWNPEALVAYFAFTDKGIKGDISDEAKADFDELLCRHHFHSITVEMWKEDFKHGLLFIDDFLGSPPKYIRHAIEVYQSVMGYMPSKYQALCRAVGSNVKEDRK